MPNNLRITVSLAALFVLALPATIAAQAARAQDPAARQRARELTAQAEDAYHAGRFEDAARGYQHAYAEIPEPDLLFDIGQCNRKLGRPALASKFFEAYLRERPDAPQRALVEGLIIEQRRALAKERVARDERTSQLRVVDASAITPRKRRVDRVDDDPALYESWWFWTGVAAVATGIAVATVVVVGDQPHETTQASLGTVRW